MSISKQSRGVNGGAHVNTEDLDVDSGIMFGYAYEEMEDAMLLSRTTVTRLVEHWLVALTS